MKKTIIRQSSIAHAVEEGRGIYDNLKKTIIDEIFYVFNSRYLLQSVLNFHGLFGNWLVWLAILVLIGCQMALTYWQLMQVLFGSVALDAHTWQMIVAVASSVFILFEIEKFFICLFMPKAAAGNSKK